MPLLLCDRDGVINQDSEHYIKSPGEFMPIAGSIEALAQLSQAGWRIAVVTNQSGLARGLFTLSTLHAIHQKLHQLVQSAGGRIDAIFLCPHGPDAGCACRKPGPALFQQALARFHVVASDALAVGDSLRDLQGAAAAGVAAVLVRTGNGLLTEARAQDPSGDLSTQQALRLPPDTRIYENLAALADSLLRKH
ncbi:MAG: D-glycero-beta-D-manno-heptose 1,7-bisphosphate 7-phosphatase [Betaproteobacteria bacterium]|jgi:D-glycero-D-manno-heptose 1,7-bisphosphate phosphatase|nr:D-glycero-beta-D-manno-heptose 1,7-bisphosphate 7-phosphatase [Betaproteobacteria bacterium]